VEVKVPGEVKKTTIDIEPAVDLALGRGVNTLDIVTFADRFGSIRPAAGDGPFRLIPSDA
jgi:hypothetical protein